MKRPLHIVVLGLSITSSWGNGHATTYRALVRALAALGHRVLFLERDMPWYAAHRDELRPQGCRTELYSSLDDLSSRFASAVRSADAVVLGSYVPDGIDVMRWMLRTARGLRLFYDIDTPITLAALARGESTYLARDAIPELDIYLSFTGGPVLRQIEQELGARRALPLYCSVDARAYSPLRRTPVRDLGYLGTYSADRQPVLERLLLEPARALPHGRFVVAGSCFPEQPWPANVERIQHVPPQEHAAFYCSQRFTLNVTRSDMVRCGYSPSVRLFEAAACGVPIISDRWRGIEEFFQPGQEILLADEPAQVLDYLRHSSEADRQRLAQSARARVLKEHTSLHRARQLEQYLYELQAVRPARAWRALAANEAPAAVAAQATSGAGPATEP
jgi:spore maturation protein CgeB